MLGGAALAAGGTARTARTARTASTAGTVVVAVTDAPGDFISYVLDIDSLKLTRSDGTVVEALAAPTQIDFASLTSLSEIISAERIAAGRYVSAAITLGYADATVVIDNGSAGVTIAPSHIIDGATGKPLTAPNPTRLTLTLSLGHNGALVVPAHGVTALALSFNLLSPNTITPSVTDPSTVTVRPVATASLTPDAGKMLHVLGALVSVNASAGRYVIAVRPSSLGRLTVNATAVTIYMINGTGYAGSAGLAQLASAGPGTMTAAYGSWDGTLHAFTASSVQAGSNVTGSLRHRAAGVLLAGGGGSVRNRAIPPSSAQRDEQLHGVLQLLRARPDTAEQGLRVAALRIDQLQHRGLAGGVAGSLQDQ
jgi:hypothetical protein